MSDKKDFEKGIPKEIKTKVEGVPFSIWDYFIQEFIKPTVLLLDNDILINFRDKTYKIRIDNIKSIKLERINRIIAFFKYFFVIVFVIGILILIWIKIRITTVKSAVYNIITGNELSGFEIISLLSLIFGFRSKILMIFIIIVIFIVVLIISWKLTSFERKYGKLLIFTKDSPAMISIGPFKEAASWEKYIKSKFIKNEISQIDKIKGKTAYIKPTILNFVRRRKMK
jgi:hypothetical protein